MLKKAAESCADHEPFLIVDYFVSESELYRYSALLTLGSTVPVSNMSLS